MKTLCNPMARRPCSDSILPELEKQRKLRMSQNYKDFVILMLLALKNLLQTSVGFGIDLL